MKLNKSLATIAATAVLSVGVTLIAQNPGVNVNKHLHPNINAAQRLLEQAIQRTTNAQRANEYDAKGHAEKAKQLMDQADSELKLAAEALNSDGHR
jgi:hypothetical protein